MALGTMLAASPAAAQSRYDIGGMTCERVTRILRVEGSAILRYRSPKNPSLVLYDRYVSVSRGCGIGQTSVTSSLPVAGGRSCQVSQCVRVSTD